MRYKFVIIVEVEDDKDEYGEDDISDYVSLCMEQSDLQDWYIDEITHIKDKEKNNVE